MLLGKSLDKFFEELVCLTVFQLRSLSMLIWF